VSALEVIIIIVVVLMLLLIVGGLVITGRRSRAEEGDLRIALREADQALALARAEDRGWDRGLLEAACREAFAERSPVEPRELLLVKVVDRPGTEEDQALFRVITDAGSEDVLLARHGDAWAAAGPVPGPEPADP
jgi:type II secretory pathway pseudopilin PulG